ncbi:MASE1 domain-containing protein [Dyella nitratireducens]|uniref:Histidine kinase n=1 Tax=Dyella nitratireducens TaxID=1849580 RepID=A0ABQ1G1Q8_9GAMM|nr:MASE1 domain-containing protein [Dyella nitratireducens]GGA33821.1 histidine kinase [Dyella nitratireducens]GLQ40781.1 histidine kinase [Dyella nitratireducens]
MEKGTGFRGREWIIQIAVALAYALAYCAIRPFSDAHWSLTSGLRFACLLLIPYRYWAALAIGEVVPLAYSVFGNVGLFGVVTASIWSIPPMAIAMPVVWFCRSRLALFPAQRVVDMKALLICALVTSLLWATVTYAGYLTATDPTMHVTLIMFAGVFVGSYVAILTLATWPLFIKVARNGRSVRDMLIEATNSSLASDTVLCALPALVAIAFLSAQLDANSAVVLQMSLFIPVAWLTLKYGWRGAAASGPLAVACVCALTLSVPDPVVIQAQFFVAFAVTFLFAMGARITSQLHAQQQQRLSVDKALSVAQQAFHQGELRMRQASAQLDLVGGAVSLTNGRILRNVQRFLSPDERAILVRDATQTKDRIFGLAESFHPIAWRERGLPAALKETIGRVLDEAGIAYRFEMGGRGLSKLAPSVHQAIYRAACEAIAQVCTQLTCSQVTLLLRGGELHGRRWAALRVVGINDEMDVGRLARRIALSGNIAAKLGVNPNQGPSLTTQAELFDGIVHSARSAASSSVSVLLYDAQHLWGIERVQPRQAQMWVR